MTTFFRLFFFLLCSIVAQQTQAQKWGWATLIAPTNSTSVTILDTNSTVIKQWTNLSGSTGYSNYLMRGGDLWRTVRVPGASMTGGGVHGRIQKIDWNGNILFDYTIASSTEIAHHDICPMPNGNVLVIVYQVKTGAQMSAIGGPNLTRWTEKVLELQPTGLNTADIVWEWHLWDHLMQNVDASKPNYYTSPLDHPELLNINYANTRTDWVHMNGIDYNADLNQIVVSSHFLNEMWVIDHSTTTAQAAGHTGGNGGKGGDFLYRWGNPPAYGAGGTNTLNVVHDAHWVPANCPNANYLVAFNNRGISTTQSCIDLINPPYDGYNYAHTPGQAYTPTSYDIRQNTSGFSSNMGNSQQFPNGNMLICLATAGTVRELNPDGLVIWNYTGSGSIPQASRYERCYIENPAVVAVTANPTLCVGGSTQLNITPSATNVSNFTYNWSPSTGLSSTTAQNPTLSGLTSSNIYTVTVSTPGGCTATKEVPVTVLQSPNITISGNITISPGQFTTLTASGGESYQWNTGPLVPSITVAPTVTTTYTVTATAGGCASTASVTVFVDQNAVSASASSSNNNFCLGASAQLSANALGGNGTYTYAWSSMPSGFTSSVANPTISPTVTTTYTVTVTSGSASTISAVQVVVRQPPTANAGNDVNITLGNSTMLSASGGSTYAWSNGATTASTSVSPTTTTTYTVIVTGANGCTATDAVVVNVTNTPLTATASASPQTLCAGESTQLIGTAGGGNATNYTFAWTSNPAGFTSSSATPSITPTQTTTYTLTVTAGTQTATATTTVIVEAQIIPTFTQFPPYCNGANIPPLPTTSNNSTSINGTWSPAIINNLATTTYLFTPALGQCATTATQTIAIHPIMVADAGDDVSIMLGESTPLTATGGGTYLWNNGATTASINVSPTSTTTYTVVVTANGCSATDQVTVFVLNNPLSATVTAANNVICNGEVTQLFAQVVGNTGNLTYAWTSSPAGFVSTIADPFINPTETTTYHLTVSDGAFFTTATIQITVNPLPAQPTISANGTELQSSSATNNQWFFYGSPIAGATNQLFTPTETGSFQVQVQDANDCYSSLSEPIFFELSNPLVLTISGTDTVICNGDVLQLAAQLTGNTGTPTYAWTSAPVGFESTISDPFVNPTETTVYTLVVVDGAHSVTATFIVTVNSLPEQPTITTVNDTTLQSSSTTNNQWFFYGSPIAGASNQVFTPTETGSFQVQVQDANGCYSPLSEPVFVEVIGVNDLDNTLQWSISPNPASQSFRLNGLENIAWYEVKLYDLQGRLVLWKQNQPSFVEVGHLASGVYVVALQTKDGISVRKLSVD